MQSDRRHHLEQNDLAGTVTALADRARPYMGTLGLAVAATVIGLAAWTLIEGRRSAAREESWEACIAALNGGQPAALDGIAVRYPGTPAAQWARLVLADGMLDQGSRLLASDRPQAEQRLQAAVAAYSSLLASSPLGFVAERATFGLAKAQENLGNLDEARRGYEAVVAEHPGSAVKRMAEERIAALGRESTRQWYAWFAQQKPAAQPKPDAEPAAPSSRDAAPAESGDGEPAGGTGAGSGTDAPG